MLPTQCDLLTPVSDHRTQMRSIRRQVQCLGNWQANHLPGSFLQLDSLDRRVKGFGSTLSLLLANVQGRSAKSAINTDPVEDSVMSNVPFAASNTSFVQVAPAQDLMRAIISPFGAMTKTWPREACATKSRSF